MLIIFTVVTITRTRCARVFIWWFQI